MSTAYSNIVAGLVATPPTHAPVGKNSGRERVIMDNFEVLAADVADTDIIVLCRLPSNVRLTSLQIGNDELDANASPTATFDIGGYKPDGTVIDVDALGTSVAQFGAATALTELLYETKTIEDVGEYLWQMLGLSADPGGMIDIALTMDAANATAAAGTIAFVIKYTLD